MAEGDRTAFQLVRANAVNIILTVFVPAIVFSTVTHFLPRVLKPSSRLSADDIALIANSVSIALLVAWVVAFFAVWRIIRSVMLGWVLLRATRLSGLRRVFPGSVRDKAEEKVAELVASKQRVQLLLCSGWHHIGNRSRADQKGFLVDAIGKRMKDSASLEVLLLNPASSCVPDRANASKIPDDLYVEGIRAVIWTLRGLWEEGDRHIEVRLLDTVPAAQLVLTKNEVWVWSTSKATDEALVHCFSREQPDGVGSIFADQWEAAWASATRVDLRTVTKPQFKKVKNREQSSNHTPTPPQLPAVTSDTVEPIPEGASEEPSRSRSNGKPRKKQSAKP